MSETSKKSELIYDNPRKLLPAMFCVQTMGDGIYHVAAMVALVDEKNGVVKFMNGDSIEAMFRFDEISCFWRIS